MLSKKVICLVSVLLCTLLFAGCIAESPDTGTSVHSENMNSVLSYSSEADSREKEDLYDTIIKSLIAAFSAVAEDEMEVPEIPGLSYMYSRHTELAQVGYVLADLNGDGIQELILSGIDSPFIYDLYTVEDGKAVQLFSSGERYGHYLYSDGLIELQWNDSAVESGHDFYRIVKGKLELVQRVAYDAYRALELGLIGDFSEEDEDRCYFKSVSRNTADYVPVTADEALEIISGYQESRQPLTVELVPLSEYQMG